ncbi:sialoadhesin [Polymixia lowei]
MAEEQHEAAAALWRGAQALSPVPSVPDRVHALAGSCVVIPCSYTPRPLKGRRGRVDVRLRSRGSGRFFPLRSTAFNSEVGDTVSRDFQGRTSLYGRVADGDCSVKIERVSLDDSRDFEMALKGGDEPFWGKPSSLTLDVSESPEAPLISGTGSATEGQLVTLNCTVSHYCPSRPPTLQWHLERGVKGNSSERGDVKLLYPQAQRPVLLASVSFTASYRVKPRLRCEASYPGERRVSALRDLHVTFPPKDVNVQVQTLTVLEGASALLVCTCKADPPVSEYHWSYTQHGRAVNLHQRTHTVRVYNVTRDMRVRCSAQNLVGRGVSHPTALNIQYKPVILHLSSGCVVEGLEVLCRCTVESNPRSALTWSVNGSVPPIGYNLSITSDPGTLTSTLRGRMDNPLRVICFAVNALGNDSLILLQGGEVAGSLSWLVILAVVLSLAAIFLLALLLLCCCRKKAGRHVLSRPPAVYPEELGIYQDRMPLYINCTEVTHIYTNGSYQLVYQNCTPLFVRAKQTHPIGRRGGERRVGERRRGERRGGERQVGLGARPVREIQTAAVAEMETAIYVEIL